MFCLLSVSVIHVETPRYLPYPRGVVPEAEVSVMIHPLPVKAVYE